MFSYLLVVVHRDAEQPGEIHQTAVAHHVGDVPAAKRGRDVEEEQDEDGVPDDAAHLQAVARREDVPVIWTDGMSERARALPARARQNPLPDSYMHRNKLTITGE